jgi:pimeloyl-ACP methyl ester carboxylesterase
MADGEQVPDTRYATLGDDRIAYQVLGEGEVDLVYLPTTGDSMEPRWAWPPYANYLCRLAAHARLVMFDRRGSGVSDSPSDESLPAWERWAEDAQAVLDEVGSERAVIFGNADSGATAILFTVAHPDRTRGLILGNASARLAGDVNYKGIDVKTARWLFETWGTEAQVKAMNPDAGQDAEFCRWQARAQRQAIRPRDWRALVRSEASLDVREALATVRVPTLVLNRQSYELIPAEHGRYLAEHIPEARYVELPGRDATFFSEPAAEGLACIEGFLKGLQENPEPDRALAAILSPTSSNLPPAPHPSEIGSGATYWKRTMP